MSLETRLIALASAVGADVKTLTNAIGALSSLNTTAKNNLVAAINEVLGVAQAAAGGGTSINDAAGDGDTTVAWSANKIYDELQALRQDVIDTLTDGAGATLDTLNELANALGNDANFATTIATALANRIRYDAAQTLSAPQQLQACQNIGVGNNERDLAADYVSARDA